MEHGRPFSRQWRSHVESIRALLLSPKQPTFTKSVPVPNPCKVSLKLLSVSLDKSLHAAIKEEQSFQSKLPRVPLQTRKLLHEAGIGPTFIEIFTTSATTRAAWALSTLRNLRVNEHHTFDLERSNFFLSLINLSFLSFFFQMTRSYLHSCGRNLVVITSYLGCVIMGACIIAMARVIRAEIRVLILNPL